MQLVLALDNPFLDPSSGGSIVLSWTNTLFSIYFSFEVAGRTDFIAASMVNFFSTVGLVENHITGCYKDATRLFSGRVQLS
jgi:hypothetical protein